MLVDFLRVLVGYLTIVMVIYDHVFGDEFLQEKSREYCSIGSFFFHSKDVEEPDCLA